MADLVQQVNPCLATACKNTTDIAVDSNGLNVSEYVADFTLNQTKAIDKKLASCDRINPLSVNHTSGGTVLKFNAGMYELFRMCTRAAFSNKRREAESSIDHHLDRDDAGNVFRENYKISINSCHQYTINLFHTTCTVLVNGPKVIEHFLQRDLPLMASCISEKNRDEANNLNTHIREALLGTKPKTRQLGFDTDLLQQPHNCESLEGSSPKPLPMLELADPAAKQWNQQEKSVVSLVEQDNGDAANLHHEAAHSESSEAVDVEPTLVQETEKPEPMLSSHLDDSTETTTDCIDTCQYRNTKRKMARCDFCYKRFHWICIDEDSKRFPSGWKCVDCRQLPRVINDLHLDLSKALACNANLLNLYNLKVAECDKLKNEVQRLNSEVVKLSARLNLAASNSKQNDNVPNSKLSKYQELYSDKVKGEHKGILLIGDSLLRKVDSNTCDRSCRVVSKSGATIVDIENQLSCDPEKYFRIIVVIGTNNLKHGASASQILASYKSLLTTALTCAKHVTVSSIPPRLDIDIEQQLVLETVNANLMELCASMNCDFVNHDLNFRSADHSPIESLLCEDQLHLNFFGTKQLLSNLDLSYLSITGRSTPPNKPHPNKTSSRKSDYKNSHEKALHMSTSQISLNKADSNPSSRRLQNQRKVHLKIQDHNAGPCDYETERQPSTPDLSYWRPDSAQVKRRRRPTHHGRQPDHLDHRRHQSDESNGWQTDWAQKYDHTYHQGKYYFNPYSVDNHKCFYCGEGGHTSQICGHGRQIKCSCLGHKWRVCPY